ncbi:MAG: hypothetical protein IJI12_04700 [Atopobiaceae bacterium]|nr:hypothetical protein [Atopobiaceae bacterium]
MEHTLIRLLLSIIPEVLYQVAVTRLLNMRSKAAYHTIKTTEHLVVMTLNDLNMLPASARFGTLVLFNILLPIVLSQGHLAQRILRALALLLVTFLMELFGSAIYIAVFDQAGQGMQAIGHESIPSMAAVYLILTIISVPLYEMTVAVFNRGTKHNETYFRMPTIMLALCAFLVFIFNYIRFLGSPRIQTFSLGCAWLMLIGACLIFVVARRDAASQREAADAALAARKAKHTVDQVQAMAWRARGLEALRHSLASDVREVPRLAASGQVDDATRKLSGLAEQAHILNGGER